MQKVLKIGLIIAAVLLTLLCANSILRSVRFLSEKQKRETIVLARLLCIRDVQYAFYEKKGYYANNFDSLIYAINKKEIIAACAPDSLKYIPFSKQKLVEMEVGKVLLSDGTDKEAFEIKAPFFSYLADLDEEEISRLQTESIRLKSYPGLRISSED